MSKIDLTNLYKTQISQTEWLDAIQHTHTQAFRLEDNEKRERLRRLQEVVGLPYDKPHQFSAQTVADRPAEFEAFLAEHGHELCALRLIPTDPALPKLRMRGHSIRKSLDWFAQQAVDPSKYRVDFVPHPTGQSWATIFVLNQAGAFGEIIQGSHAQLTQGLYEDTPPIRFAWDFETLTLTPHQPEAAAHLTQIFAWLKVEDPEARALLEVDMDATFSHNYLQGYFETTLSEEFGLWFIDYNRVLGKMYENFSPKVAAPQAAILTGRAGSPGKVTGRARVIDSLSESPQLEADEILVCRMTTPDYVPLMQQAAAIVTDMGGILSHAAIVARELGKPCLTATGNATTLLNTGQLIEVDADAGIVRLL